MYEEPLVPVAAALRDGRRTPTEYATALADRIAEVDPEIRAYVDEPDRRARLQREASARDAVDPWERGPLHGVPVGVKDIFHARGLPTRAGSDLPPDKLAGPEATVVSRLREAGAVVAGKTVTTEFAYFSPGPTRNPHDTDRTPGGSSSGSAAAVAAGLAPLALGTQTVGSVIRPAAFCGVVGVKPSYGRVPTHGVIPLAESVDHVGYFTRDVDGARLAGSVLCDGWRGDVADAVAASDDRPILGVPDDAYLSQATPTGRDSFRDHLDALADAGFEVRRTDALADIEAINDRHERLVAAEAATAHHEWFEEYADRYHEETVELLRDGRAIPTEDVAAARASRTAVRERLHERMDDEGIDVWASPAAPGPAPEGLDSTGDPVVNLPWTHAGLPTVSLPAGETTAGLPVGLQCSARFGADERLLAWAGELAAAL